MTYLEGLVMTDPFTPPGVQFYHVSPKLALMRFLKLGITLLIFGLGTLIPAILVSPWIWLGFAAVLVGHVWAAVFITRQVRNTQYATGEREFFLKQGVMFKRLQVIPYGRIQYVDLNEGVLERIFGLSSLSINTAAESGLSGVNLPGLTAVDATNLRAYLYQRGEAENVAR